MSRTPPPLREEDIFPAEVIWNFANEAINGMNDAFINMGSRGPNVAITVHLMSLMVEAQNDLNDEMTSDRLKDLREQFANSLQLLREKCRERRGDRVQ